MLRNVRGHSVTAPWVWIVAALPRRAAAESISILLLNPIGSMVLILSFGAQ